MPFGMLSPAQFPGRVQRSNHKGWKRCVFRPRHFTMVPRPGGLADKSGPRRGSCKDNPVVASVLGVRFTGRSPRVLHALAKPFRLSALVYASAAKM